VRAGELVELDVDAVAHGGHCVARLEGRVVFVRHTLPGERVLARLTETGATRSYWRADAVDVLRASPDRVPSVWLAAGPGGVGGAELAHVALPAQRRWKATVVAEQLRRLAGLELDVQVEAAPGDDERGGLGWRTRITTVADARGWAGMHRHRSDEIEAIDEMPLASEQIAQLELFDRQWPPGARIDAVAPVGGDRPLVLVDGVPWAGTRPDTRPNARTSVREVVAVAAVAGLRSQYRYRVAGAGFWQVHRQAPAVLVAAVADALAGTDLAGGTVVDLYSGAGLFTQPLADLVGAGGRVVAVEGDGQAARDARRGSHGLPQVELHTGDVAEVLASGAVWQAEAVVLDPPRVGAGATAVALVTALRPRVVVYVACDPAALARDVGTFASRGYDLASLRAVDLFPHTHHVECVAVLVPSA
jgi:tRNA/tmRNA/rRNA uracil-C5-methylase (TrmA/RlmC/RlmD family)